MDKKIKTMRYKPKNEFTYKLGQYLKNARISQGIIQKFVAKRAGITPTMLYYIEAGKKSPSTETLLMIAWTLKIDLNNLLLSTIVPAKIHNQSVHDDQKDGG